jgi:hypothetical protein
MQGPENVTRRGNRVSSATISMTVARASLCLGGAVRLDADEGPKFSGVA